MSAAVQVASCSRCGAAGGTPSAQFGETLCEGCTGECEALAGKSDRDLTAADALALVREWLVLAHRHLDRGDRASTLRCINFARAVLRKAK